MQFVMGVIAGAVVLAGGILIGLHLREEKKQEPHEETIEEREEREKEEDIRRQWESMLRFDGRAKG